jgi:hypothetical protein
MPKARPPPTSSLACDNMPCTIGRRIARPVRSAPIRTAAAGQFPASANAGTASTLIAYPMNVSAQWRPVLSAMYPETARIV